MDLVAKVIMIMAIKEKKKMLWMLRKNERKRVRVCMRKRECEREREREKPIFHFPLLYLLHQSFLPIVKNLDVSNGNELI